MKPKLCYEGINDTDSCELCLEGNNEEDCVHLLKGSSWEDCRTGKLHDRYQFLLTEGANAPEYSEGEVIICPWCEDLQNDNYELKEGEHTCPNCGGVFELNIECIRKCTTYKR